MANRTIASTLCNLIVAYWTPERIELWHEYEKTDRSITWREYEYLHRKLINPISDSSKQSQNGTA